MTKVLKFQVPIEALSVSAALELEKALKRAIKVNIELVYCDQYPNGCLMTTAQLKAYKRKCGASDVVTHAEVEDSAMLKALISLGITFT